MNARNLAALGASVVVLAAAIATAAVVFHPDLRVATGDSMEPTISGPAIVHCTSGEFTAADIDEGDIVAVNPGNADRFELGNASSGAIMHRVTFIDDDVTPANLKTQGDNEASSDGYSGVENIECVYSSHVELPVL
jgi:signal peptidase I